MIEAACTVALDVGGSSIKIGAVDSDARCWQGASIEINHAADADVLLDRFAEAFRMGRRLAPRPTKQLGIAFPAPFDYAAGIPLMTHKFGSLYRQSLRPALIERVGEPLTIRFVNDAAAAGIGEFHSSADPKGRMLFITLGTGFGSALIDGGRVVYEHDVGDLWQTSAPGGTADDVFSARGLAARLSTDMDGLPESLERSHSRSVDIALNGFGAALGTFLAPTTLTTGAAEVVIGGGLSAAFARFAAPLQAELPVPVRVSHLQNGAGVLGAGMHLLTSEAA